MSDQLEALEKIRELKIEAARRDFWEYCKLEDPQFYNDGHAYLRRFARVLQAFYEKRIVREYVGNKEDNYGWFISKNPRPDLELCHRLQVNMPPRHGKTRTVALFESWCLGVDPSNRIIAGSYNDTVAGDLSRAVRDKISEVATNRWRAVFSDVFPKVKLKAGDASIIRWSLEGQFFNYLATGVGGSSTGKGCSILVVDDPIKNAEEAFNKTTMAKVNSWIRDTLLSRMEGDAIMLLVMTRWPGGDPCEDFEDGETADTFYRYIMRARQKDGTMLAPDILSEKTYEQRKLETDESVFSANYDQEIITPKNAMYPSLRTYADLPRDPLTDEILADQWLGYCDTADSGDNYLVAIAGITRGQEIYVTGVVYTQAPQEETEDLVAQLFVQTGTKNVMIESNSGGKAFAKAVDERIRKVYGTNSVNVEWFHQSANKEARILSNAASVCRRILFPIDWTTRWPEYSRAMRTFVRIGRNRFDDAPDATTGLLEIADGPGVILA